jgi:DUF4097 and DUF4098 domain-containing protein YvlB
VNADDGRVIVRTGTGNGVTVHRVLRYEKARPKPTESLSNGTLTFENNCRQCRIDYELTVPATVAVRARTGSGHIEVSGVASADVGSDSGSIAVMNVAKGLSAHTDSGSIKLENVSGDLDTSTDSGSIHGRAVSASTVRASSDSGGIKLEFAKAPTTVRATNDSGSVSFALPGGPYHVDVATDSGGKHVTVPFSSDSKLELYVRTDSGGVTLIPA